MRRIFVEKRWPSYRRKIFWQARLFYWFGRNKKTTCAPNYGFLFHGAASFFIEIHEMKRYQSAMGAPPNLIPSIYCSGKFNGYCKPTKSDASNVFRREIGPVVQPHSFFLLLYLFCSPWHIRRGICRYARTLSHSGPAGRIRRAYCRVSSWHPSGPLVPVSRLGGSNGERPGGTCGIGDVRRGSGAFVRCNIWLRIGLKDRN